MHTFSLIVATLGRTTELENLFESLASLAYPGFECIIVDQNSDRRVKDIVDWWKGVLNLRVVDSAPGLSRARNVGLALATGDVVAFPDDDCWYNPSLLASVSNWFEQHSEYGILTVGSEDLDGVTSGNRWIQDHCEIRASNAFQNDFFIHDFRSSVPPQLETKFLMNRLELAQERVLALRRKRHDHILGHLFGLAGVRGYFDPNLAHRPS